MNERIRKRARSGDHPAGWRPGSDVALACAQPDVVPDISFVLRCTQEGWSLCSTFASTDSKSHYLPNDRPGLALLASMLGGRIPVEVLPLTQCNAAVSARGHIALDVEASFPLVGDMCDMSAVRSRNGDQRKTLSLLRPSRSSLALDATVISRTWFATHEARTSESRGRLYPPPPGYASLLRKSMLNTAQHVEAVLLVQHYPQLQLLCKTP